MTLSNTQRVALGTLVAVCLVSLTVAAWAIAKWGFARSGNPDKTGGITVTDSAQVKVAPDTAFVTFGVSNSNKNARVAGRDNAAKTSAVIAAIVKAGIPKSDIQTVDYSLEPSMDYGERPAKFVGYSASNSVRLRTKNIAGLGDLIDAATAAGANNVQGVVFDVEDKKALRKQALDLAVKKAKGKAQAIADALGAKLGPAISATETVNEYIPDSRNSVMEMPKVAETSVMPGETSVSAQVEVVYSVL